MDLHNLPLEVLAYTISLLDLSFEDVLQLRFVSNLFCQAINKYLIEPHLIKNAKAIQFYNKTTCRKLWKITKFSGIPQKTIKKKRLYVAHSIVKTALADWKNWKCLCNYSLRCQESNQKRQISKRKKFIFWDVPLSTITGFEETISQGGDPPGIELF